MAARPGGVDALRIAVPAGCWELHHLPRDYAPDRFAATLTTDQAGHPTPVWSTSTASISGLEETLGWTLPAHTRQALLHTPPTLPARVADSLDADVPMTTAHRPTRASTIELPGQAPTTYGRLLHAEKPQRVYHDGTLEIQLHAGLDRVGVVVVYRLSETLPDQLPTLMFCHARHIAPDEPINAEGEIRAAAAHALDQRRTGETSPRQIAFLDRHTARLADLADGPPDHPYPPGTRVVVHPALPPLQATGTIVAALTDHSDYRWRPDLADLPGHPWAAHPTWALPIHRDATHATLDPPDTDVSVPQPGAISPYVPAVITTGALVATIDDPRFSTGTVLRTFADDTHRLRLQVQPHDAPLPPQLLPLHDLIPLRPAAWPDIETLIRARLDGNLPLQPDEALLTLSEVGHVDDHDPTDSVITAPPPWTPHPLQVPHDDLTATAATADLAPPHHPTPTSTPAAAVSVHHAGDTVHIHDPTHGHLAVRTDLYLRALRQPASALTDLLARRPWIRTYPDQPHPVTAALATKYAAADLPIAAANQEAAPVGPGEATPAQTDPAAAMHSNAATTPGHDPSTSLEW